MGADSSRLLTWAVRRHGGGRCTSARRCGGEPAAAAHVRGGGCKGRRVRPFERRRQAQIAVPTRLPLCDDRARANLSSGARGTQRPAPLAPCVLRSTRTPAPTTARSMACKRRRRGRARRRMPAHQDSRGTLIRLRDTRAAPRASRSAIDEHTRDAYVCLAPAVALHAHGVGRTGRAGICELGDHTRVLGQSLRADHDAKSMRHALLDAVVYKESAVLSDGLQRVKRWPDWT